MIEIGNWRALLRQLSKLSGHSGIPRVLCRGQSESGDLISSLGRLLRSAELSPDENWRLEWMAVQEFRRKFPRWVRETQRSRNLPLPLRLWPVMQHHGAPTRLLD